MVTSLVDLQAVIGDRYQIDRELGRGGMATVYLARDSHTGGEVAVKVLHQDLGMAMGAERFRREIDIASKLSHPHILAIQDFGGVGGTLYFVMPLVKGETLAARMQREGMMPLEDAVRITCQVARALEHAHRHGIVHRDVKPENILFENGEAVLADFGIARAISDSDANQRLTKTGLTLGTPVYMSPEQAVAERAIDGRSDIYSLGCVLYEMLVGQPPFVGPTAQAIIARQMMGEVPSITVVRGTVPDEVEDAVMRALAKQPVDRFTTALEFAEALEASLVTAGRSLGSADRRSRSRKRRANGRAASGGRRAAIAGSALALLVAAGAGWWTFGRDLRAAGATAADGLPAQRIGVLYFEDQSADSSLGAVADGLTEELITQLGGVPALDVVSRNGVAPFRGTAVAPDSVATALGAGTLVYGSVEPAGRDVRVVVRLVDGASGADYKRASFAVPAGSLLAARDSVADQVARFLRARVGEEVKLRETRRATANDGAWRAALQGERLLKTARVQLKSGDSAAATLSRSRADSLFARAAALDPQWVEPIVQRGRLALDAFRGTRRTFEAARWSEDGLKLAQQALMAAPRDPGALALRGTLRLERWRRHLEPDPRAAAALLAGAEQDLKQATTLAPGDAAAWSELARVYYEKPNLVEATLAAREAYEKDAYLVDADWILWRLYATAYDSESFTDAVNWCGEGRKRFPDNYLFVRCQLWLFTSDARAPDAAAAWQLHAELKRLTPAGEWAYTGREAQLLVAAAVGRAGMKDSASRIMLAARAGPDVDPERELLTIEAFVRDLLGERDEALALLKQYLTLQPDHRRGFRESQSWWWRGLKSDPAFAISSDSGTDARQHDRRRRRRSQPPRAR
jgi:serine/threonine-protein kinase